MSTSKTFSTWYDKLISFTLILGESIDLNLKAEMKLWRTQKAGCPPFEGDLAAFSDMACKTIRLVSNTEVKQRNGSLKEMMTYSISLVQGFWHNILVINNEAVECQ